MALAKFLQISDLHLGAPCTWLPAARREDRRRERQRALEDAVTAAIERRADAILLPGDLFDRDGPDAETIAFALHAFDRAACPPVFIAPGNHDPFSNASPVWSRRLLEARGWRWPGHVRIFGGAEWESASLDRHPIRIWGRCSTTNVVSTDRPLADAALERVRSSKGAPVHHVALFHGSLEGHLPPSQTTTTPFSEEELAASPFAYVAVGHYHLASRITEGRPEAPMVGVRMAYAGSTVALDPTEIGAHGALEVRVHYGDEKPFVELEPITLDPRRVHALTVDLTGLAGADAVDRRIAGALDDADVAHRDIATIRLTGRLTRGVRLSGPGADLDARVFHLRLDRRGLRPDYDLDALRHADGKTTEERFARALLERLDVESDPAERRTIESALYYGLDAFRLRDVGPVYEEIGE